MLINPMVILPLGSGEFQHDSFRKHVRGGFGEDPLIDARAIADELTLLAEIDNAAYRERLGLHTMRSGPALKTILHDHPDAKILLVVTDQPVDVASAMRKGDTAGFVPHVMQAWPNVTTFLNHVTLTCSPNSLEVVTQQLTRALEGRLDGVDCYILDGSTPQIRQALQHVVVRQLTPGAVAWSVSTRTGQVDVSPLAIEPPDRPAVHLVLARALASTLPHLAQIALGELDPELADRVDAALRDDTTRRRLIEELRRGQ